MPICSSCLLKAKASRWLNLFTSSQQAERRERWDEHYQASSMFSCAKLQNLEGWRAWKKLYLITPPWGRREWEGLKGSQRKGEGPDINKPKQLPPSPPWRVSKRSLMEWEEKTGGSVSVGPERATHETFEGLWRLKRRRFWQVERGMWREGGECVLTCFHSEDS